MSTLNVNTITGVQVFDFTNTPFANTANAAYGFANSVNTFSSIELHKFATEQSEIGRAHV